MTLMLKVGEVTLPAGFILRPAEDRDLENIVETLNACTTQLYGISEETVAGLRLGWETPGMDRSECIQVVEAPDGKIAGYLEIWAIRQPPVHPSIWARVHPHYEGLGIGTTLLQRAEQYTRSVLDKCPPAARVSFTTACKSGHQPAERLFESLGLKAVRYSWHMEIQLAAPPVVQLPAGISIRTYRHDEDLLAVCQATTQAFRDHWGFIEEPIEGVLDRWRHWIEDEEGFDAGFWFLAIDDYSGEVAGISLCRNPAMHDSSIGWVNTLGVRRPWRRRGLGLALLQHSFRAFWEKGMHRVGLGVDAGSLTGATRLYEKAGMHVDRQYTTYELEIRPGVELATTSVEE
jgi:mycothiol synthase